MELTIGYTYYTNKPMFEKIKKIYTENYNPNLKFVIVDDGSPFNQLTEEDMPEGWTLYRITEDIGFNNEGARNLIMHVAETEWVFMTDLDHYINPQMIPIAHEIPRPLQNNPDKLWTCNRILPEENKWKVHCNSFFVKKEFWDSFGGYDETWSGHYGFDHMMGWNGSVRAQWIRSDRTIPACHPYVELIKEGTASEGSKWTNEEKNRDKHDWRSRKHEFKPTNDRLRFPWKRIN